MKPILRVGHNCWAIDSAQQAGLLVDGRDFYRAFYQAAQRARRYILLAGWQFDSSVPLLCGHDARHACGAVALLPFLNQLCKASPHLRVYLLAWDFNLFYMLKREFLQAGLFQRKANHRIQFRFDATHPVGGCHHQKLAVLDGTLAFVGGMDLCWGTWDDRRHRLKHRHRLGVDKKCYIPRHDVQSYHTGPVVNRLTKLFTRRWRLAGGEPLKLPRCPVEPLPFRSTYPFPASSVAISRTMGKTLQPPQCAINEIRKLYEDAIAAAEKIIYIENQYFSSYAVYRALIKRMLERGRSRLRIIIVMARQPEAFIEEIGLGTIQAKYLHAMTRVAARTRHRLGIYNSRAGGIKSTATTYIHSKLMVIDDRFLTVGSANLSNRSMGFDSELNVAWEAAHPGHRQLQQAIRRIRIGLLAEHGGVYRAEELRRLAHTQGLMDYLNTLVNYPRYRLRHHRIGHRLLSEWVTSLTAHELVIDPQKSHLAERLEMLWSHGDSLTKNLVSLGGRLARG